MSEYIEFKIEDSTPSATPANPGYRRKASIIIVESKEISRLKGLIPTSTDAVLTCLKNNNVSAPASVSASASASTDTSQIQQPPATTDNNLYSLSIKFFSQEEITVKKGEMKGNEHIYIMPQNDADKGKFVSISDEQEKPYSLKYILITGKLINGLGESGQTADTNKNLSIDKVFYILNKAPDKIEHKILTNDVLTKEEFLNLYYINYFSFDNTKFTELYNSLINDGSSPDPGAGAGPNLGAGGGSKLVKKKKQNRVK